MNLNELNNGIRLSDGPAIWGGCVTRRKHRAGSRLLARKSPGVRKLAESNGATRI
jgi:hypothetical protein